MEIKISIIYLTNRIEPKFEWFVQSLRNQTGEDERRSIELVFIDTLAEEPGRKQQIESLTQGFPVVHSLPKPSLYQGRERHTKTEMFSASSARNTGIILSNGNYLVFVDDVSVLMPGWWAAVWQGYVHNRITCGSYWKHFKMDVAGGVLVSSEPHEKGKDSRWNQGSNMGPVLIYGDQLYGCSLAIPAVDVIALNGFDELCDSIGGEDYQFGKRLSNAGKKIYYDRSMFTVESEELHGNENGIMLREDRVLDAKTYADRLYSQFAVHKRMRGKEHARTDSSHMILDILYGTNQVKSRYNFYSIEESRITKKLPAVPEIYNHWFDDKPLAEI